MIEIDKVHKSFGKLDVLKGVSMTVNKGEVISVIGGSGSGKSTLLMCINGLEAIQGGVIRVDGTDVHAPQTNINLSLLKSNKTEQHTKERERRVQTRS